MTKRICWKRGMRLTDDILRASDNSSYEVVGRSLMLAASGRFGLIPSPQPFELTINVAGGLIDVESLNCLAVTKDGSLIDAHYDTRFTNTFDTRVQIPEGKGEEEYLLTIDAVPGQWRETNDGFEEPVYTFSLIAPNTPVPAHSLPIGRIVNQFGWRMDDADFVPPCLFVASHPKYVELSRQFRDVLSAIDGKVREQLQSEGKNVFRIFWPIVQQLMITMDKECDTMTPMSLLANVQKCVSAFTCACDLDDYLELEDGEKFQAYVSAPYTYKDAYQRIKEGLGLCFSINEKVGKLNAQPSQPSTIPAPTIDASQLLKKCSDKAKIQVTNHVPGAVVYYTVDGGEPDQKSRSGQIIMVDTGFSSQRKKEPNKVVIVKVKAILNGVSSSTNTYKVTLQKDIEGWTGREI